MRIAIYLIGEKENIISKTGYRGLVVNPTFELYRGSFVDSTFSGLWGHEDDQDPSCVNICTGFLISLDGTPLMWFYKMKKLIAMNHIEEEFIKLIHSMIELLPFLWLIEKLDNLLGLEHDH